MHEVVTVQLGNRANYLATHFWNIQESYFTYPTPTNPAPEPSLVDHDIHFRPGIGADGSDTYTPRTLIYDFQQNFGGLRKLNALYETLDPNQQVKGLWDGVQQTQTNPPIQPIQYQIDLESGTPTQQLYSPSVRYWSDFNRLFYHPHSIQPISPHSFSSSLNALESWSNGVELYRSLDLETDILDRDIRPFVEESDSLSSFQIYTSTDDSWGGYASHYLEALREEYPKKSIWTWGIEDGTVQQRAKQYTRFANAARSLRAITQHASAYIRLSTVPASLPTYINLETESEWSTSALLCAAVESATLPARLRGPSPNLGLFEDVINTTGAQNVWSLGLSGGDSRANKGVADPRLPNNTTIVKDPTHLDIDFSPTAPAIPQTFPSLRRPPRPKPHHVFSQIESCRSLSRCSALTTHRDSTVQIYHTPLPMPLLTSYPSTLFTSSTGSIPLRASLSATSAVKTSVLALRDLVAGRTGRGMGLIESEEVEGVYDDLTRIAGGFECGVEGSDDDEEHDAVDD